MSRPILASHSNHAVRSCFRQATQPRRPGRTRGFPPYAMRRECLRRVVSLSESSHLTGAPFVLSAAEFSRRVTIIESIRGAGLDPSRTINLMTPGIAVMAFIVARQDRS